MKIFYGNIIDLNIVLVSGIQQSDSVLHIHIAILFFFCLFRAEPEAYGGSQARDPIGAVAASLRHSHSHSRYVRATSATYTTAHGNAGS